MALHFSRNKVFTDPQMRVHTCTYCFQLLFDIWLLKCATSQADAWHPKLPLRPILHSTSGFGWAKLDFRDSVLLKFRVPFLNTGSQNGVTWIKGVFLQPHLKYITAALTVLNASAKQRSLLPQVKWCTVACEHADTFLRAQRWNHTT